MHAYMMYLAVLGSTLALDRLMVAPFLSLSLSLYSVVCACGGRESARWECDVPSSKRAAVVFLFSSLLATASTWEEEVF